MISTRRAKFVTCGGFAASHPRAAPCPTRTASFHSGLPGFIACHSSAEFSRILLRFPGFARLLPSWQLSHARGRRCHGICHVRHADAASLFGNGLRLFRPFPARRCGDGSINSAVKPASFGPISPGPSGLGGSIFTCLAGISAAFLAPSPSSPRAGYSSLLATKCRMRRLALSLAAALERAGYACFRSFIAYVIVSYHPRAGGGVQSGIAGARHCS